MTLQNAINEAELVCDQALCVSQSLEVHTLSAQTEAKRIEMTNLKQQITDLQRRYAGAKAAFEESQRVTRIKAEIVRQKEAAFMKTLCSEQALAMLSEVRERIDAEESDPAQA